MSTQSQSRLSLAERHLASAEEFLLAQPIAFAAALEQLCEAIEATLKAHVDAFGADFDTEASLESLATRVVNNDSVMKTVVNRAMLLVRRRPAIAGALVLSVHDREDVETGRYTVRNLIDAVATFARS